MASTSWPTTAASARGIARTTARSKCAALISSITTSGRSAKRKSPAQFSIYKEYFAPLTTKGAPDIVKLQKNPNVTVRMRGVMEKCTFCVQRIEEAKIAAHVRAGASNNTRIPRDSFTSACAQACPTEAIVFGDITDPESRVSKMKEQDRNYRLLEYLNVNTRTSYLARIRNPNPKMPDAHKMRGSGQRAVENEEHRKNRAKHGVSNTQIPVRTGEAHCPLSHTI